MEEDDDDDDDEKTVILVGSYCTDISRCTINKTLNIQKKVAEYTHIKITQTKGRFWKLYPSVYSSQLEIGTEHISVKLQNKNSEC